MQTADPQKIVRGMVCKVVSVHHPAFSYRIGKEVVVVEDGEGSCVWASDNVPITYRTNRRGTLVVDRDPRCVRIAYGRDALVPVIGALRQW